MEFFNAGMVFYQLDIALNIWLLGLLWRADRRPYFLAYTAFRLVVSLVRFPILLIGGMDMYTQAYWLTSGILIFASIWLLCDFFPKLTALISLVAVVLSFKQLLHPSVALERNVEIAMFVAALYILLRDPKNMVAAGFAIATLLPALGETQGALLDGNLLRFIPSFVFLLAQTVWIFGVLKPRDSKHFSNGYLQPRIH
jgi:hypothetical protein